MRLIRPPALLHCLYPEALFRVKTNEKILYLTFDDGPDPESTPLLLEILGRYDIKALFFCSGKAAERNPELIEKVKSMGHVVGNHGYNHLNGFLTTAGKYCSDVNIASGFTSAKLFRPPYGRLRISQYKRLRKSYFIVFWDIMPYDFDKKTSPRISLQILLSKIRPGSIIALHDTYASSCNDFLNEFLETSLRFEFRFKLPEFSL